MEHILAIHYLKVNVPRGTCITTLTNPDFNIAKLKRHLIWKLAAQNINDVLDMLSLRTMKVVAGNINNLTDARYFAAWNVVALIYVLDNVNKAEVNRLKEMIDWIEGPLAILDATNSPVADRDEIMQEIRARGLASYDTNTGGSFLFLQDGHTHTTTSQSQIWNFALSDQDEINLSRQSQKTYIAYPKNSLAAVVQWYKKYKHVGVYLEGGKEDKVGLKAYDEMDELFELLSEEEITN